MTFKEFCSIHCLFIDTDGLLVYTTVAGYGTISAKLPDKYRAELVKILDYGCRTYDEICKLENTLDNDTAIWAALYARYIGRRKEMNEFGYVPEVVCNEEENTAFDQRIEEVREMKIDPIQRPDWVIKSRPVYEIPFDQGDFKATGFEVFDGSEWFLEWEDVEGRTLYRRTY